MNVTIISGSPKGEKSVTLQYLIYIEKHFQEHRFTFFHVGEKIERIEKDDTSFQEIVASIKDADAVIWITPVYVMAVPYQMKRFIELIGERKAGKAFKGKYTAVVTSSIHFFDHTANNYMEAVCSDMGMKFAGYHSLDMYDIFNSKSRKNLLTFAGNFFRTVENKHSLSKRYFPQGKTLPYRSSLPIKQVDQGDKKIVLLTDSRDPKKNLAKMVHRFCGSFSREIEVINIHDIDIKGPCKSCLQCGYENICIYRDGFAQFWDVKLAQADIIIFAGTITDRYLSSRWKLIFDRAFYKNHTPSLSGKHFGFLISGRLSENENLQEILQAYVEFQESSLVDMVSDEYENSKDIDNLITTLAHQAVFLSHAGYKKPGTFLFQGAMKLFRDDVWGRLRFVFQADHRHYKKNGFYDTFPQKDAFARKINRRFMLLTKFSRFRKVFYKKVVDELLRPIHAIAVHPDK